MATGIGTILKLSVTINGLSPLTMDDVDFTIDFFVYNNRPVRVTRREMLRNGENEYVAVVDTSQLGSGEIRYKAIVDIPDTDIEGGMRREICIESTGIKTVG